MKRKVWLGVFITLSLALMMFSVICGLHFDDGPVWVVLECISLMLYDVSDLCIFSLYNGGK